MTEQERLAFGEILTAIENLSISLDRVREVLVQKGLVSSQELLDLKGPHAPKARTALKQARRILQIPQK